MLARRRLDMGKTPSAVPKLTAITHAPSSKETCVQLLQLLISGAAQGCIYGLIALGFVLIYKATETVSFAQGDLMMVGAFSSGFGAPGTGAKSMGWPFGCGLF